VSQSNLDLQVLAAQLRRHTDDLSLYGGMLVNVLSSALPPELVEVRRERRLFKRGDAPVLGVSATLGNLRFDLDREGVGAPPATRVCHQSGGVVMSTSRVPPDEWCRQLAAALAEHAGTNEAAIAALERLVTP
jgi:hypothetical protein